MIEESAIQQYERARVAFDEARKAYHEELDPFAKETGYMYVNDCLRALQVALKRCEDEGVSTL